MAGLVAFERGVVQVGEFGGAERGGVEAGVGGEGGGQLADEMAGGVAGQAQHGVVGMGEEVEGVGVRGDRIGVDAPVAVGAATGAEAVDEGVGDREAVSGVPSGAVPSGSGVRISS